MIRKGFHFGLGVGLALALSVVLYAVASYPSSTKSFSTRIDGQTIAAAWFNEIQDEIVAIENGLRLGVDHDLLPLTDGTRDLGTTSKNWRDGWFSRNVDIEGTLAAHGASTLGGALTVTGATTLTGGVSGATTFTGVITAPGVPVLLHADSGTSTAAAVTNVDTIAITGLTAKDTLKIELTLGSTTQSTGNVRLVSVTDSNQDLLDVTQSGGAIVAGQLSMGTATLRQRQTSALKQLNVFLGYDPILATVGGSNTWNNPTTTTAWTGSWTLALRHGGVTAGGTFDWSWAVFKIPGQ